MGVTSTINRLGRAVAYYPTITKMLGGDVSAAVFLCQFNYWRSKVGGREIYKTRAEIEDETGISERVQKRVCDLLKQRGYVQIVKKGMPAKNYYRFDWDRFDRDFEAWDAAQSVPNVPTSEDESSRLVSTDRTDKSVPNVPTTSETTTETTTEITREPVTKRKSKNRRTADRIDHPVHHVPCGKAQYEHLTTDYGKKVVEDYIERVVNWCAARDKSYSDYAAAAANWLKRDGVPKIKDQYAHEFPVGRDFS
jgi:hypothetical protein